MITTYHRPKTLQEALTLLARPNTRALGGGTLLSHPQSDSVEVVDLQALNLNALNRVGNDLDAGASVTLQALIDSAECPAALKTAAQLEAPLNIRNAATIAGALVASDGRSPFAAALLALDVKIKIAGDTETTIGISEYLLTRPQRLITNILIPLNVQFAFEAVSKTPSDTPLLCAALTQWNSGRTRLTLGGYGKTPLLAMDGTEADGLETAARNAYHEARDEWASAEYRMDVAATLAKRCLATINLQP